MKRSRSFANTPSDERQEKPNRDRMNKNSPSRFLWGQPGNNRDLSRYSLETRDIIGDAVEQKSADQSHNYSHDIVESHEEWVPAHQLYPTETPFDIPVEILESTL
jgi:hypothetical protein